MSANDESSNNEEEDNIEVTIENELQKTIGDAFLLFTSENNRQSISVTDLGKVIRHIGCVPSELELKEFAKEVVNPKYPKIIKINVFMRHMEMQIRAFRYRPGTAIELFQAFQLLDMDRKGSLSIEEIETALKDGESFDDDEIAYAIKSSYDPDNECIYYDTWINKLLGKTKTDIYALIPVDKLDEKDAVLKQLLDQNQNKL